MDNRTSVTGERSPSTPPAGDDRYHALRSALRGAAPFSLALFDASLAVVEADDAFAAATDAPPHALTAAALFGVHAEAGSAAIRRVLATGEVVANLEFELFRPAAAPGVPPRLGYRVTFYPVPGEGAPTTGVGAMLWERTGLAGIAGVENAAAEALRRVAHAVPALISAADAAGNVTFYNDRWREYLGSLPAGPALRDLRAAVHPGDRAAFEAAMVFPGATVPVEFRLRRHDGVFRWHQLRLSPVMGAEPLRPVAYVGVTVDIDDQRKAEEGLREALGRARALTNALPVLVVEVPLDGRPFTLNQVAREYLGFDEEAMARVEDWREFAHPDERERLPGLAELTRGAERVSFEFRLRAANGEYRWHVGSAAPVLDGAGRVASWICLATDIHSRKLAEEAPQRERERLQAMFAQMPAGVVLLDTVTGRMSGNPQVARIWRMETPPNGPDDPAMKGFHLDGRPYEPEDWPLRRVLRTGEEISGEIIRIERGDGTDGYLNVNAGPVREPGGAVVAVVVAFEDITAFVQAERALRATFSQLTHVYEAAPVGLAFLSRDLRFERVNGALAAINGHTPEEHAGRAVREVFPVLADLIEPICERVLEEGQAVLGLEVSMPNAARGGRPGTFVHSYYPVRDDGGEILGVGVLVADVTERRRVQERMRLSEERYRTLTNTVPQPVWSCDADGEVTLFNSRWYAYTGLETEASLGDRWLGAVYEDDYGRVRGAWEHAVQAGAEFSEEFRLRRADGECRWHLARVIPLRDDEASVIGWFGTATDIHEQRIAAIGEEVLANIGAASIASPDETSLFSAIAACLVPALGDYCLVDILAEGGRIERVAARHADPSREADMTATLATGPRSIEEWHPAARVMRTGETEIVETTPPTFADDLARDEETREVLRKLNPRAYLALPLRAHGQVLGTLSLLTSDHGHEYTTEEVELAEEAARRTALAVANARLNERTREAEALYLQLLDAVPQIVWLAGRRGGAYYFNRTWRDYTGVEEGGEVPGDGFVLPDDLEMMRERWRVSIAEGVPFECEYRLRGRDGTYRWFLARAVPLHASGGAVTGWLGTATDIEAIKRAQAALEHANQLKDEFLGLVSHELRTPLTSILGHSSLLLRHGAVMDASDRAASLDDVIREAERLQRLVENMLVLAGVEGRQEVVTEPLLVQRTIPRVVATHRQAFPGREFVVTIDPALAPVEAQPTYFDQVLQNLISNAEKYSPQGAPIEIVASAEGADVVVRVLDHGAGISPEEAEEVFRPFFRSARTASSAPGAGLGLAVCMRLIEAQGGRIWAAARDGGGTEFGFALPIVAPDGFDAEE